MSSEYIYGKNPVLALLEGNKEIINIYLQKEYKDIRIINLLEKKNIKYLYKDRKYLDTLTEKANHQGVVAEIKGYEYKDLSLLLSKIKNISNPLLIMLDGIEDPHNLGAILRSVDAVGGQGIIIGKHNQIGLNATVAKVSAGAIEYVDVVQVTNLTQTIKILKEKGFWVVGAEADGAQNYTDLDYNIPILLVVGSEGKGISPLVLKQCDFKVNIPMKGKVNSLNVSVAAALLLYGVLNKRMK